MPTCKVVIWVTVVAQSSLSVLLWHQQGASSQKTAASRSPDVFSVSLETQGRSCGKIPAGQLFVKHSDQLVRPFFQFWGSCELQRVMCIQATRQCKSAIAALWWQMNQMKCLLKVFLHVNERSAQSCCVTCCCSFEVWVQIFESLLRTRWFWFVSWCVNFLCVEAFLLLFVRFERGI